MICGLVTTFKRTLAKFRDLPAISLQVAMVLVTLLLLHCGRANSTLVPENVKKYAQTRLGRPANEAA